jgi:hypothetical protein
VERLGFGEDDTLPERLRIAADRATAAVCILIVDNIAQRSGHATRFGEAGPARRYVSVHADADHAARELSVVVGDHLRAGGRVEDLTVSILDRTVGDAHIGTSVFQIGAELPAAPTTTQELVDLDAVVDEDPIPAEVVDLDAIGAAAAARPAARPRRFWRRRR